MEQRAKVAGKNQQAKIAKKSRSYQEKAWQLAEELHLI